MIDQIEKIINNKQLFYWVVAFLLVFIFMVCILSIKNSSLTMDELAHLPAGYSYLTQKDMRLNPEHPPLIKDLAAFPLVFFKGVKFPHHIKEWQEDVNGQWSFGNYFLFKSDNPADKMIFWSRIPMILVLVLTGFYVFLLAKEFFGIKTGLFSLLLFSLSPTLLAHGCLVTTDVGVVAGVVISTYYFLKTLKDPNKKNILKTGIAFGLAQLVKFTGVFLIPYFIFLALVWTGLKIVEHKQNKIKTCLQNSTYLISIFLIGAGLVWLVYQYHIINYPLERQIRDINFILRSHPLRFLPPLLLKLAPIKILRPFAQYLFGLAMVFQRGVGGNTTYFLGQVSGAGWKNYFPTLYILKIPLAFHALTLIAIYSVILSIKKPVTKNIPKEIKNWLKSHFTEFSLLAFIIFYWLITLWGNLNIGIRHLLPVFPLTIILVAKIVAAWLTPPHLKVKCLLVAFLVIWQTISVLSVFPHFIAYYNEIIGGPSKGHLYAVDSNLDWGQDLKRLRDWVEGNEINNIYVDYFGGADTNYYLGEKYQAWRGDQNPQEIQRPAYLAVSATLLQGGRGKPAPNFNQPYGYYLWLNKEKVVARIGYSIFVYKIE